MCFHWTTITHYVSTLISEKVSQIVIAGGYRDTSGIQGVRLGVIEILTGDKPTKLIPDLPENIVDSTSLVLHNGNILLCGGYNEKKCFILEHGTWKEHSTLNMKRTFHSIATTQNATFIFGGLYSRWTYEYLPRGSKTWIMGKTEIPEGVCHVSAVTVKSEQEILLIGDNRTFDKRILTFNVNDHTFRVLPFKTKASRNDHRCAFIPNTNKVIITGGRNNDDILSSTEILDTETGEVTMRNPLNTKRAWHGIGILTINGEDRVAVFGGWDGEIRDEKLDRLDSVELYNRKTGKWEVSNIKLKKPKSNFSFLTVKLSDIISKP